MRRLLTAMAVFLLTVTVKPKAQTLDTVCFIEDLPALLASGVLIDTAGPLANLDTVVINGGTCDSVNATLYLTGVPIGLRVTAVKMNSCSVFVTIAMLGDTVVSVCPTGIVAHAQKGREPSGGGNALRIDGLRETAPVSDEVRIYNLDGTVADPRNLKTAGRAAGVRVLVHTVPR